MSETANNTDVVTFEEAQEMRRGFLADAHLGVLEDWLDQRFSLFGFRFGLDGLIGLIPGMGDLATTGVSAIFVADAIKSSARRHVIRRMLANILVDFVFGAIPIVGDLFDFAFKSNLKNLRLLRDEKAWLAENKEAGTPRSLPESG